VVIVCEARVHANPTDVEARLYRSATFSPNDTAEPNALGREGTANERQWLCSLPHSGPLSCGRSFINAVPTESDSQSPKNQRTKTADGHRWTQIWGCRCL